jgi:hypothetical protein
MWMTLATKKSIEMQAIPAQALDETPVPDGPVTIPEGGGNSREGLRRGITMYEYVRNVPRQALGSMEISPRHLTTDTWLQNSQICFATMSVPAPPPNKTEPRTTKRVIVERLPARQWTEEQLKTAEERLNELAHVSKPRRNRRL